MRESASTDQIRQFGEPFAGRTPQSVAAAREEWNNLQKNVAALGKAGVKLVLGTDVGGNTGGPLLGWTEHIELENMVAAGMTPAAAIAAATRGSADALRLTELGTIAAGKRADFIVLDANPLDGHHELAEDLDGLSARRGDQSRGTQGSVEQTSQPPRAPSQ